MKSLVTSTSGDRNLDKLSQNLKLWSLQFNQEIIDGTLLKDVKLTSSETLVSHGLGRVPQGWIIVDNNADTRIWRSSDSTSTLLPLTASGTTTVSLWVF